MDRIEEKKNETQSAALYYKVRQFLNTMNTFNDLNGIKLKAADNELSKMINEQDSQTQFGRIMLFYLKEIEYAWNCKDMQRLIELKRVQKIMFYKHCDWEYENEFRIIGRNNPNDPEEDGGWFIKPGFWAECRSYGLKVKQIIFGFNCSLQNKARVMEIVNKHNHDVLMARMVEYDFRFPMSKFIKNISEEGDFISIAQMVRIKDSLKLERQGLDKTDTWIYK